MFRAIDGARHRLGARVVVCARSVLGGLHQENSLARALTWSNICGVQVSLTAPGCGVALTSWPRRGVRSPYDAIEAHTTRDQPCRLAPPQATGEQAARVVPQATDRLRHKTLIDTFGSADPGAPARAKLSAGHHVRRGRRWNAPRQHTAWGRGDRHG